MDRNDKSLTGFTMIAHAAFHAYELAIPVFLVVWLSEFSTTAAIIGFVVGIGYALVGLGAVPSGILADKYGSKQLVLGSILIMGGGFGLIGLSPNLWVLTIALITWGIGASIYHPAGLSLLSRGAEQRGTAFAYHGAAGNVGTVIGPLFAAVGLVFFNWRIVAFLFVIPAVIAAILAFRLEFDETAAVDTDTEEDSNGITSVHQLITDTRLLFTGGFIIVFIIVMVYGMYFRGILTFLPEILSGVESLSRQQLFGYEVEPSQYVFAGLLLVGVFGQYAGGRLSDLYSVELTLVGSFIILILASLLFVPAANAGVLSLLVICFLIGFFLYLIAPVYQAAIANYVSADTHGLSYGYTYLGTFGIGALGAPIAGSALAFTTESVLFVILAVFVGLGAILSYFLHTSTT